MKTNRFGYLLNDNAGAVMPMVLLILALLTLMGLMASDKSNTEVQRAGDKLAYHQNFYLAEGAAMEAVEAFEKNANPKNNRPDWLENMIGNIDEDNVNNNWENTVGTIPELAVVDPADHTRFLAAPEGIAPGNSMSMSRSRVHAYVIYGRAGDDQPAMIKIGYLKAF